MEATGEPAYLRIQSRCHSHEPVQRVHIADRAGLISQLGNAGLVCQRPARACGLDRSEHHLPRRREIECVLIANRSALDVVHRHG